MVGSMFEPFSIEAINSSKYRDFIERSLAVDTFQPDRHIGLAVGAYGDDWTFKGGIFSTSFGDASSIRLAAIRPPGEFRVFIFPTRAAAVLSRPTPLGCRPQAADSTSISPAV